MATPVTNIMFSASMDAGGEWTFAINAWYMLKDFSDNVVSCPVTYDVDPAKPLSEILAEVKAQAEKK